METIGEKDIKWICQSNYDYFCTLPENKIRLQHGACNNFRIPAIGVVFVFDKFDYHESSEYGGESIWKNIGNHVNIKEGDGVNDKSPPKIAKIMRSCDFSHLIWLSKRAWAGLEIDFVWNLSHELRHLEQDLENHFFALAGNFLYRNLAGIKIDEPKLDVTVPTELDAELAAWRTVRKLFGQKRADLYVNNLYQSGNRQEAIQILSTYDPEAIYDVRSSLIALIRKYQPQLDDVICNVYGTSSVLQNVDHICSELENVT